MGSGASSSSKSAVMLDSTDIVVRSKSSGEPNIESLDNLGADGGVQSDEEINQEINIKLDDDIEEIEIEAEEERKDEISATSGQIVLTNNVLADEDKPEYQQHQSKSLTRKLVETLTLQKSAPPPPSFNLPVAGWSKDPAVIEHALEKRRKHLKVVKVKKKVEKASHKITNNGPLLDWACLSIRDIPTNDLQFFKSKTSVDLSHNPLNQLPVGIGTQHHLQHLNLHDCDFTLEGLPQSLFSGLTNLSVLDLSCNMLDEITEEFGYLGSLKRLILHSNRIERIDDAIAKCPLEHLEVQNNQVYVFPLCL